MTQTSTRQVLALVGVVSMMLIAGCFSPPGPPDEGNQTPTTPEPEPYTNDASEINFPTVHNDSVSNLKNATESGLHARLVVNITDPRLEEGNQTYTEEYRINQRTDKRWYSSDFQEMEHAKYHDSVLYYEKTGNQTSATPISEVNESNLITIEEAAGKSPFVQVGMNSVEYSLSDVQYRDDVEESRYTGSQSVSNYALDDMIPEDMAYDFGSPQMTGEEISSTVVMTENGTMIGYQFKYTSTIFVDGEEKDYELTVRYQIVERGPAVPVSQPDWAQNASTS